MDNRIADLVRDSGALVRTGISWTIKYLSAAFGVISRRLVGL